MSNYGMKSPGLDCTTARKVPEMPESMKELSPVDIIAAATAISQSPIAWPLNAITQTMENCPTLKDWEVRQLEEAFRSFLAKYNSPLAKALK